MQPVAFDTETALIKVGLLAPPLTCITWADGASTRLDWIGSTGAYDYLKGMLSDPNRLLIGLNVAYDCGVVAAEWPDLLPLVFDAYRKNRITDISLRQKLIDIAKGKFRGRTDAITGEFRSYEYSLAALVKRYLGKERDKVTHRTFFGELRGVHPSAWPKGAAEYALEDARDTYDIFAIQEKEESAYLQDQFRQTRAAWGLHLISCWGIRTDPLQIARFQEVVEKDHKEAVAICLREGLVRDTGTRDTKAARTRILKVMGALGEKAKVTPTYIELRRKRDTGGELTPRNIKDLADPLFGISVDEDACESSCDPVLIAYAKVTSLTTVVDTHIPALKNGINYPIQARFEPLVETGRTSCKGNDKKGPVNGYQLQNVRRLPGIRECFVPREGFIYADADFSGLELHTWAQTCLWGLGESKLADALNQKIDPHLVLASTMMELTYDETKRRYKDGDEKVAGPQGSRQFAKIGNFGFQGGMAAKTFRAWARAQYKTVFAEEQADFIRTSWQRTWPESDAYFRWIKAQCEQGGGYATIEQWMSGRTRGLVTFTVAANSYFQGLGADATKAALFAIAQECYVDQGTALYGCRIVNYVHDSYMLEVPDDLRKADASAKRLVDVMVKEATKWLPDVPPRAEVTLSRKWSKNTRVATNKEGLLIPWEDRA